MAEPTPHAALTPEGVRDGSPAALALIVDRRGPAVLAFCAEVCAPDAAAEATAEAFARFRGAVAAAADPRGLDPDGLLLSATRHAAAASASRPAPSRPSRLTRMLRGAPDPTVVCAEVPGLVVARAEGSLSADEDDRLERHLRRDHGCRELEEAFLRAETAFHHPPDVPLPVEVLTGVLAAMVAVAPIRGGDELPAPAPRRPPGPPRSPGASSVTPVGRPGPAASTPVGVAPDEPATPPPAPSPRAEVDVEEAHAAPPAKVVVPTPPSRPPPARALLRPRAARRVDRRGRRRRPRRRRRLRRSVRPIRRRGGRTRRPRSRRRRRDGDRPRGRLPRAGPRPGRRPARARPDRARAPDAARRPGRRAGRRDGARRPVGAS